MGLPGPRRRVAIRATLLLLLLGSWALAVQVSRPATLSVRIIDANTGELDSCPRSPAGRQWRAASGRRRRHPV